MQKEGFMEVLLIRFSPYTFEPDLKEGFADFLLKIDKMVLKIKGVKVTLRKKFDFALIKLPLVPQFKTGNPWYSPILFVNREHHLEFIIKARKEIDEKWPPKKWEGKYQLPEEIQNLAVENV